MRDFAVFPLTLNVEPVNGCRIKKADRIRTIFYFKLQASVYHRGLKEEAPKKIKRR